MQIRALHVKNFLTFSDLTVTLSSEAVNVWVGPNGAGKTNALRVIRHLIDGIQTCANQSNSMSEWTETLRHWIWDPSNRPRSKSV